MRGISGRGAEMLRIDPSTEAKRLEDELREAVLTKMKKRGCVLGLSGGVDSTVSAYICVNALGRNRVFGIFMPEKETKGETNSLGRKVAEELGIKTVEEDITAPLESVGCYRRRDSSVKELVPEYGPGWKCKVVLPSIIDSDRLNVSHLVAVDPGGESRTVRMTLSSYLGIIAASNFKQRTRKMVEYYHADRLNYAVVGTPNRLEYELGFFVKNGDGAADLKPIAHLYKSQVYQLAEHYGVSREVTQRTPTTDTFPMEQTQEEFYFSLPLAMMDLALYCYNNGIEGSEFSEVSGLSPEKAERVLRDIAQKKRSTTYLHLTPQVFGEIALHEGDPSGTWPE